MKTEFSNSQIKERLMRYCDKAERCQQDVLKRAMQLGLKYNEASEYLSQLIAEGFVSEQRFASAYVHDKFTFNRWGARKIESALKLKGVSEMNIRAALRQIPKEDETETILELIKKKELQIKGLQLYQKKVKIFRFLLSKGFDSESIERAWKLHLNC
jgi:regulatory protein